MSNKVESLFGKVFKEGNSESSWETIKESKLSKKFLPLVKEIKVNEGDYGKYATVVLKDNKFANFKLDIGSVLEVGDRIDPKTFTYFLKKNVEDGTEIERYDGEAL